MGFAVRDDAACDRGAHARQERERALVGLVEVDLTSLSEKIGGLDGGFGALVERRRGAWLAAQLGARE